MPTRSAFSFYSVGKIAFNVSPVVARVEARILRRVGEDLPPFTPHRPGRAGFPIPVFLTGSFAREFELADGGSWRGKGMAWRNVLKRAI